MSVSDKIYRHKKGSVYAVFLLSYISILLLTLSSSIVYYMQISKQITAQTEISRQLLLTQLQTTVEDGTQDIENLCNEIAFDKTVYQFAKELPSFTVKDVKNILSSKMYRGDMLYDYFIYIRATDEIITPTLKMSAENFYRVIYSFEDMSYEEFRSQYLDDVHFQKYMPIQNIMQYDALVPILPFIQTFPVDNSQEPLGQIICFIDAGKLFDNVSLIRQSTGSAVYVLDQNKELITASEDAPALDTSLIDSAASGKITKDGIISKRTADSTGWQFVIHTPRYLSLTENRGFLTTALGIFLLYLAAGLFLVRFLTAKSYRPILEINTLIHANTPQALPYPGTVNEFDTIKDTILHQIQNDKKLTGIINVQIPYVRRAIFDRMLKGLLVDYDTVYHNLAELDIVFPCDDFLLVSLEVDDASPFLGTDGTLEENRYLARLVASNVGSELFSEHFFCYYLDYEQQLCVFLLSPLDGLAGDSLRSTVLNKTGELLQFIRQKFALNCYIGISSLHASLRETPLCFDEARKASEYGHLVQAEMPVSFEDLLNLEGNYYYPAEIEYQLINSLKSGHFDQAKALIDHVFQLNTHDKSLSVLALKGLLFELSTTLMKQVNSISIAKGEPPSTDLLDICFAEVLSIEAARTQYFEMIDQISYRKFDDTGSSKTEKLAAAIAAYIVDHAGEQWIDLNTLSEEFHVTPPYISNIFKRYRNENIKDYISKVKLERAKELLLTTDLSVNEIAQRLGWAGEIGIIRLFKKYEGVTPGDFRNAKN